MRSIVIWGMVDQRTCRRSDSPSSTQLALSIGRTALVTGAGHRVGRAIALALGARGMRVAVHYNAAERGARETLDQIHAAGGSGEVVAADLTQPDVPSILVEDVVAKFGGVDVL